MLFLHHLSTSLESLTLENLHVWEPKVYDMAFVFQSKRVQLGIENMEQEEKGLPLKDYHQNIRGDWFHQSHVADTQWVYENNSKANDTTIYQKPFVLVSRMLASGECTILFISCLCQYSTVLESEYFSNVNVLGLSFNSLLKRMCMLSETLHALPQGLSSPLCYCLNN